MSLCAGCKEIYPIMIIAVLNVLFLLAFLLSAAVQYNDPDPLQWAAIYLAAAGMCALQMRNKLPRWLPLALLLTSVAWIGMLLPSIVGQVSLAEVFESITMKTKAVEEAREIGGLILVGLWAAALVYRERRLVHR
jgi:hypothetical protein